MKKQHIIGIVLIAVAIGAILTSLSTGSTYASFKEADEKPRSEYHVVGKLDTAKPAIYDPAKNANEFTFYMIDNEGAEKKVILAKAKPQDFERSEQLVIIGKSNGPNNDFIANDILMKCPSKYNDGKPQNKTE